MDSQFSLIDAQNGIVMVFVGVVDQQVNQTPQEIIEAYLDNLFVDVVIVYDARPDELKTVDGIESQSFALTGTFNGFPSIGEAVVVIVNENQFLFAYGSAQSDINPNNWQVRGAPAFDAILSSIVFNPYITGATLCAQSTDPTYGYSPENPIRIGGDAIGGPARERAYLDVLRGPNGEAVTYERTGSEGFADTILDLFAVTIQGQAGAKRLYIDEYTYGDLSIPVGFTCTYPIPLNEP